MPVPGHVGDDAAGAAVPVQPRKGLPQVTAVTGPAASGEPVLYRAVRMLDDAHVEGDRDPLAMRGDRPGAPCRVLQRSRSEDDPRRSGGERPLQRGVVADAARQLNLDVELPEDGRSSSALEPRPNAASRSTRWIHSAPSACHASAASRGAPELVSVPASPRTRRTARPSDTSTAGRSVKITDRTVPSNIRARRPRIGWPTAQCSGPRAIGISLPSSYRVCWGRPARAVIAHTAFAINWTPGGVDVGVRPRPRR